MKNSEISQILSLIAIYEDMLDGGFKSRAYEKASRIIDSLSEELSDIYQSGGFEAILDIPGIGEGIGKKIIDLIEKGTTKHLEDLRKKIPVDVEALSKVEGIGPKKIKIFWKKLKIKNIEDLKNALTSHKIQKLEGFGKKSEEEIIRNLEFLQKHQGRFLLGEMLPVLETIVKRLEKIPSVNRVILAGSSRRMKETIGDGDFLVSTDEPQYVIDFFVAMPEVVHVYSKGKTKALVKLENNLEADLRAVSEKSFGAASQYFTGNKEHNIKLRKIAIKKGWKLNEYGLFSGERFLVGKTEEEIYDKLGMKWIPPEMREYNGEIDLAQTENIPKLISYESLKGDLQMHSVWSDGNSSILDLAHTAKKIGLQYIAITDHSKRLKIAGGIDEKQLDQQSQEIDKVNKKTEGITVLKGIEVDILKDGTLDFEDKVLKKLDVVGASIHSHFNLSQREQTKRILRILENENVDILFHPTARLIQRREPCEIDLEKIFDVSKNTGTLLEIDSTPGRLDLNGDNVRLAKKTGCKFVIDSDSHSPPEFECLKFGIGQARRGWLEEKDVVNTLNLKNFLKNLKG